MENSNTQLLFVESFLMEKNERKHLNLILSVLYAVVGKRGRVSIFALLIMHKVVGIIWNTSRRMLFQNNLL